MSFIRKNFFYLIALALIAGVFLYRKDEIAQFAEQKLRAPCKSVISYSIGEFGAQFGISEDTFLRQISIAEQSWEDAYGGELFAHESDGELTINLIYDYRQQATDKLRSIGYDIKSDRATYDTLKSRYNSMNASYIATRQQIQTDIKLLEARRLQYEESVASWNAKGGAPENEYKKLETEKAAINREISRINKASETLNDTTDTLNSLATVINQLINELNLNVEKYNDTTGSTGEEFDEGEFVIESGKRRIDIYQFDDEVKLRRVLIHELGHALGLDHVDNTGAIMYKVNQSTNTVLTGADIDELRRVCGTI